MKERVFIIALFVILITTAVSFVYHFYGGGRRGVSVPTVTTGHEGGRTSAVSGVTGEGARTGLSTTVAGSIERIGMPARLSIRPGSTRSPEAGYSSPPVARLGNWVSSIIMSHSGFTSVSSGRHITGARSNETVAPTPTPVKERFITGLVTDPNNLPVTGARVILIPGTGDMRNRAEALTDAGGRYSLRHSLAGTLGIRAMPPPDSDFTPSEIVLFIVQDGDESITKDLMLKEGELVQGIVLNEEKTPVVGAKVEAVIPNTMTKVRTTDEGGRFSVKGVPAGGAIITLTVSHPEYQSETRTAVNMFDGEQTFILKRANSIILEVTWKLDGTPVEFYAYRLLKKMGFGELFVDAEKQNVLVESLDGRTSLTELPSGTWHVEVTVMSPDGNPTDLRGATNFQLEAGQQGMLVRVAMDGGRRISGRVVMNTAGGSPVAGANIEFVTPSAGFGRFPKPDGPFVFPTAATDETGEFKFEGMPPGRYTVQARKETFRTPMAVDVIVPYDVDPTPVEIVMLKGGVLFGKVLGADGKTLEGVRILLSEQRVNADGWLNQETMTDAEGNYRFEGLPAGAHYLWAYDKERLRDSRTVDLEPGKELEVNFDFSGNIQMSGNIRVNGKPPGESWSVEFIGEGDSRSGWVNVSPEGYYKATVKPGLMYLHLAGANSPGGQPEAFNIPEMPSEQVRDIDLNIVDADIVLSFPEGVQFVPGNLVISPRQRATRYGFYRVKMDQQTRHVVSMFAGEYQATLMSTGGEWHGETDWVTLAPGATNTFVLDLKKTKRGVCVGGWAPGQVSMGAFTPLSFDVTPVIESAGNIEIYVLYQTGRHAVETGAVSLIVDGAPAVTDDHKGWSGADQWNNTYHLNLGTYVPGAAYVLRVELKCDGGTDSTGSIFMSLN